ncbi:family 43 glycosylhydrolase [Cellulosimicrobium arenosum]|uniref:Family 43 glycosylhydrolase n=1 Tax=Cellulosimicrobium arenosum TaxID=2708133 RepID=A0A927J178_9MICO|nr:family 43 glycosylhydrolase [Cellulosimicrobium arenosum]MBD8080024.1 family 43 glycosylhydrolase [Cellulosimicrobium arenosum]
MCNPRRRAALAGTLASTLALGAFVVTAAPASAADSSTFTSTQNPILDDGSYYSADPAPLVVPAGAPGNETDGDQLYIYTGHDEAGPTRNDFVMNEWGAFSTSDVDAGEWTHYPSLMRPEEVFDWATPGRAYAGQVVQGLDDRYYWYVPVAEAETTASDAFGIGIAVADSPTGPWTDYVGAPIISQRVPTPNTIHNIDPTILIDGEGEDARVYVWWGSFGNLRMLELEQDMRTPVGTVRTVTGLTGYFEAPWAFERNGTYYMAYAGNNAGPTSQCTPANYHACIAYATATSPQGPWTYRGTVLAPVSSTTSHPGILEFDGEWWIAYHTADAEGGNHFRRSVAIDRVKWDDTQTPPRMERVVTTPATTQDVTPRANVAQEATVTVSNEPVPTQYWKKALNDELVRPNPLPPDMWGTWTGSNPPQQWVQYTWDQPMRLTGSQIEFWNDQPQGTGVGVAAPASWRIQYWDASDGGAWVDVANPSAYGTGTSGYQDTTFDAVTTTQVRAVFDASTNGSTYSAVAVEEWKVLAAQPDAVEPPEVTVEVGETDLPGTVEVTYPGGETLQVPAFWDEVAAADVAAPGSFAVEGSVLGYAGGRVSADVTVLAAEAAPGDETAPTVALTALGSAGSDGWFRSDVRVRVDGTDDSGGRVVLATAVDDGEPVTTEHVRTTEVAVTGDGEHTVVATATDRAGNVSGEESLDVRIDRVAPVSTGTLDPDARTVAVAATDATSGVVRVEYAIGTGEWATYDGPVAAPDTNQHRVSFRAVDAAGNVETPKSVTIPADVSGPLTGNVAPIATVSASYTAGWNSLGALNDGADPTNPSQAQIWGTWSGSRPASLWTRYDWSRPIRLTGAELKFWRDSNQGTGDGVAAPDSWVLEYWDDEAETWQPVTNPSAYGTSTTAFNTVTFDPVTTSRLRATFAANGNGTTYSAVAVTEWRVVADDPGTVDPGPELDLTTTVQARCLAGRAYVAVRATNTSNGAAEVPVDVTLSTPYGEKSFAAVAPGKNAYQSFAVRAPSVPAGSVTVTGTATVDGEEVTVDRDVQHDAVDCA